MPFGIEKRGGKHVVVNTETGRVMGTHPSPEKARAQLTALKKNVREEVAAAIPGLPSLREVETFSKPGIGDVTPSDYKKISPIVRHYASQPHPFTSCYRDQIKHGLPPEHAKRRCSVVKQLGARHEEDVEADPAWYAACAEVTLEMLSEELGPVLVAEMALAEPVEEIWKPADLLERDFSRKERKDAAGKKQAMPDGSFPIKTRGDLINAMRAIGRAAKGKAAAVKAHIRRRAKALGLGKTLTPAFGGRMSEDALSLLGEALDEAQEAEAILREASGLIVPSQSQLNAGTRYVQRQARKSMKASKSSSSSSSSSSAHPRAPAGIPTGGQFITKGAVSALPTTVAKKLGVQGQQRFTKKDVRQYQQRQNLVVDGKIGSQTATSLLGVKVRPPGVLKPHLRRRLLSSSSGSS